MAMRKVDLAHLVILTDSGSLIVIRDDPSSPASCDDTHYGGVWDYLPLSRVCEASLDERPTGPALLCACPATSASSALLPPAAAKRGLQPIQTASGSLRLESQRHRATEKATSGPTPQLPTSFQKWLDMRL